MAKVENKQGLHARPASLFVEMAKGFKSKIWVEKDGMKVDGKSITSVLMLGADKGSEVTILAKGEDEDEAVDGLLNLVASRFGE